MCNPPSTGKWNGRVTVKLQATNPQRDDTAEREHHQQHHQQQHQQQQQHHHQPTFLTTMMKPRTALTAALLGAAAIASTATSATAAMDFVTNNSYLAGGVTKSSAWWSSLAETGFYQAFSLVFVSEIGDKTFFIAGILGAKTGRLISFIGSVAALAAMTIVSVVIGQVFHAVPAGFADGIPLDDVAAALAFAFFGLKTLKEALDMDPNEGGGGVMDEELAEAEEAVEESTSIQAAASKLGVLASIFALVFAAEFGDRSFLSTIALSAAQNPVSVAGGAIAAHAAATGIAVAGGSYIAKYISERVIGIVGGTLFLVFAATTAFGIF